MRAILLSNVPHYHHLAEALYHAGFLERYLTSPLLLDGQAAPRWMPRTFRRKLEGRRLKGVPQDVVHQIKLAEFLQKVLPQIKFLSLERANWLNNYLFDALAERWIDGCDVFHFVSSIGLQCARKAKRLGATIVCDVRQEHPAFQRNILEEEARRYGVETHVTGYSYERKVLDEFDAADFIVVPSAHARRTFVEQGFAPERIFTLPYGVELRDFRPAESIPAKFRVIYAGSLTLRKGAQYLLEAFATPELRGAELVLAGPVDPLFKPILKRFEGSFTYAGVLPKLDLQTLYASGSAFVLPSLADSFSLATLEAMACGLPVVISQNTGAGDVVDDGQSGFVVPIRDAMAIREKLTFLYDNREARLKMGARAAEAAQAMSWSRYGSKAIEIYARLEASRASAVSEVSLT